MANQQIKLIIDGISGATVATAEPVDGEGEGNFDSYTLTEQASMLGVYSFVGTYDDAVTVRPVGLWVIEVGFTKTYFFVNPNRSKFLPVTGETAGNGQYALPVLITDAADVPIPRAVVSVADAAGDSLGIYGNTDTNGLVSLLLDPGEYIIRATAYPTHTADSATVTMAESDHSLAMIALAEVEKTAPGTGGLCRVRVPVREASTAAAGARVEAQLVDENQAVGNDLVARSVTRAKTDSTGYADLLLPQGLTYRIEGFYGNHRFLSAEYSVPVEDEAYLAAGL